MTPQERQLLQDFLQQLAQARADPKDAEAAALIRDAVSRQPDADYLLVQRATGLDLALRTSQAQVAKLQAELDQSRGPATGFLNNTSSWGRAAPAANSAQARAPSASLNAAQPAVPPAVQPSAWGSGMLASLATTAAGVVAGSFLFQGMQNLMGHHNPGAGVNDPSGASRPLAANQASDALTNDEVADALNDDSNNDSVALDDGGSDLA